MKTLRTLFKQDKEAFVVPKGIQDVIPVTRIWQDGIFQVGKNKYSKCYRFTDINYAVASRADKEGMFLEYSELLNSFDTGATTKITILNRRLNKIDFEKNILLPLSNDKLDEYRKEYNKMLLDKATGANGITQEKFITVSVNKKSVEEARNYFTRISADLINHFSQLGSKCVELEAEDRLRLCHDFYRQGEENAFTFDMIQNMKKGHSFKDFICPDSFEFEKDYFKMGKKYGRVIFLKEYASYIKDNMVAELTDLNRNMMMSIDVIPVPMDEAVREVENRRLGVETNITNWQRRQNSNNNFSAVIPYDLEAQREASKEMLNDLTNRNQKMFLCNLIIVHTANSKEELDSDTESLKTTAGKYLCQLATLKYQQMDGLNTVLPSGTKRIKTNRTLITESLSAFMPFKVQEIQDAQGIYYGQNVISKNMVLVDRRNLQNGNSFILGVSGSGKSFIAKHEITSIALKDPDADIIILDPENEYAPLIKELGGEVIKISASSDNHINALDLNKDYSENHRPIVAKAEFILSLCEQIIKNITPNQKAIIDRCTNIVYKYYEQGNFKGTPPTLEDFRDVLLKQEEKEAKDIALALELFTKGNLNTFAKPTNVQTQNRLICYDIIDLGEQLTPIGMLVILDNILNRITRNRKSGKRTYIFIDEIYLLFRYKYTTEFVYTLWKRIRKYGGCATGITQNVQELLCNEKASLMLSNSEFIIMLNQSATDRDQLATLLKMSEMEQAHITNVPCGEGVIRVRSSLLPFRNKFPKNTKLYRLMTTRFDDKNKMEEIS